MHVHLSVHVCMGVCVLEGQGEAVILRMKEKEAVHNIHINQYEISHTIIRT